jgi:cardiolipin synthase
VKKDVHFLQKPTPLRIILVLALSPLPIGCQHMRLPTGNYGGQAESLPIAKNVEAESAASTQAENLVLRQATSPAVLASDLIQGNKLRLLYDGPQTMTAMRQAISQAKTSVHLETYIFDQDPLGIAFADLLIAKSKENVKVRVIYDSIGTINTAQTFFERMREAGIELLAYHPINPIRSLLADEAWDPNHRDHRKILVVDGVIAFTGGVNISDTYSNSSLFRSKRRRSSSKQALGWRDTHLQVEGPAVNAIQSTFLDTWRESDFPISIQQQSDLLPKIALQGPQSVHILASDPHTNQDIYLAYLNAIGNARHRIHITCAYFVPDQAILQQLIRAASRGVEVKLILPGVNENDLVSHASQSYFTEMLERGIHLYQMRETILHAKTAVIDGAWSTVGSANIDTRSFRYNKEINVIVIDADFGKEMEQAFEEDLSQSNQIILAQWQHRSYLLRVKQWMARQLAQWL